MSRDCGIKPPSLAGRVFVGNVVRALRVPRLIVFGSDQAVVKKVFTSKQFQSPNMWDGKHDDLPELFDVVVIIIVIIIIIIFSLCHPSEKVRVSNFFQNISNNSVTSIVLGLWYKIPSLRGFS